MSAPHVSGAVALYKADENPLALPSEILNALKASGSKPQTICNGNGFGYLANDPDRSPEPLLYVSKY